MFFCWEKVNGLFVSALSVSTILQVDAAASNLNSNDVFVLVTPDGSFSWVGVGASDPEKQGAQQLCDLLGVSVSELSEGGETGEPTRPAPSARFPFRVTGDNKSPSPEVTVREAVDTFNSLQVCHRDSSA